MLEIRENFSQCHTKSINKGGLRLNNYYKNSYSNLPLVSIITIVYNGCQFIEDTIDSVVNQDYPNIEYIIIDGGSTDGTIDILIKRSKQIDFWISEPDSGISDAFNKGIKLSNGKLIGIINSDDWYEQTAIKSVVESSNVKALIEMDEPAIIYGKTYRVKDGGHRLVKHNSKLGWAVSAPFSHCSSFVTKKYYEKNGLFDIQYRIAMDVDLLIRGIRSATYLELPLFIANQRDGGVSDKNRLLGYKEYYRTAKSQVGVFKALLGYYYKVLIYYLKY